MGWHGGEGLSGEKVLEKSLIIAGSGTARFLFQLPGGLLPLRDEATGRAGQLLPELKPRSAQGPLPSGHPRVHMPWSGEGHAQTRWAHPMWLLYK